MSSPRSHQPNPPGTNANPPDHHPPAPPPPAAIDPSSAAPAPRRGSSNIRAKFSSSNNNKNNNGPPPPPPPPPPKVSIENVDFIQPPTRISIENLDFMEQDQKQKELQEKVERHKSKKRIQRHRRNLSFGQTPSITEDGLEDNNNNNTQDWLQNVAAMNEASGTSLNFTGSAAADYNDNQYEEHAQNQHKGQSYMIPLHDSFQHQYQHHQQQLPPPPPPQSSAHASTIHGYAPWPNNSNTNAAPIITNTTTTSSNYYSEYRKHRRSASNTSSQGTPPPHPLKAGPQQHYNQQQQQHYNQQPYPEFDDEYASLLQQNFAVTSGYGATANASPLPPSGRSTSPLPPHPHPPRKGGRDATSPHYKHHKSASMPSYGAVTSVPRSRTSSDGHSAAGMGLPPPPPPSSNFNLRQGSGLHIHRRSHSDNYAKIAFQHQQQYQQYQPAAQQQHPLLRNHNANANSSAAKYHGSSASPRMGGGSRVIVPRQQQQQQQQYMDPRMTSSPGHRRVRSSGTAGIRSASYNNNNAPQQSSASYSNPMPLPSAGSASSRAGGHHRRSSSLASYSSATGVSVQSEASFLSVVSDIRKSSFYSGYNESTGKMEMHYPQENVHLTTSKDLTTGWIYATEVDTEAFEEYHRAAEEAMMWEDEDLYNLEYHKCTCQCPACYHGCTGHESNHKSRKPKDPFGALPTTTFALAVDENIYTRVMDEISQASSMPCGLFYCGHHEDVDHPSVNIALVIVVALMLGLGYIAYISEG